jgi:uncharacterized protein (DUF58 family)
LIRKEAMNSPVEAQPVFDPHNVGESLDRIQGLIPAPIHGLRGITAGTTESFQRGPGFSAANIRTYQTGDDIRKINWLVTSRQTDGSIMVQDNFQEITPNLIVVTDMLQSRNNIGYPGAHSEQKLALGAVVGLSRIAQLQQMPNAIIAGDDKSILTPKIRPQVSKKHLFGQANLLADVIKQDDKPAKRELHLKNILDFAVKPSTKRILAIVSDFREAEPNDPEKGWKEELLKISHQKTPIIAVETTNPYDYELPESTDVIMADGQPFYLTEKGKKNYIAEGKRRQAAIDEALQEAGALHIKLSTTEPRWLDSLITQLKQQ